MFILLTILVSVVAYLVVGGATHGYAKHRWAPKMERKWMYGDYHTVDVNSARRNWATIFWFFYWVFIWPFTKVNEMTFSSIEKEAGKHVAANKARIADLRATKAEVEASNAELEEAEKDLEKEISKTL